MVGDATFDIICGRDAGCKTIGVRYTMVPIEELISTNPDYLIDSPIEIVKIVKSLKKKIV
ncbi:Pyrophosphatase PpaX [compost metagenome]